MGQNIPRGNRQNELGTQNSSISQFTSWDFHFKAKLTKEWFPTCPVPRTNAPDAFSPLPSGTAPAAAGRAQQGSGLARFQSHIPAGELHLRNKARRFLKEYCH